MQDKELDLQNRKTWAQLNHDLYCELTGVHASVTIDTRINTAIVRYDGEIAFIGSIHCSQFVAVVAELSGWLPADIPF